MLFPLLHAYARLVIRLYFRKIIINRPEFLKVRGPLLLAANHPNSFLDGMIVNTLFDHPVYALARGDAFANRRFNKWLRWLRLLPVYRTSEGTENLVHNYTTFAACRKAFEEKGIVLIFSEAESTNEWRLRPLRKGTARLAITSWQQGVPLQVVPLGFNYSSFRSFGKNLVLNFGSPICREDVLQQDSEGRQLLQFNEQLEKQLQDLVYEFDPSDENTMQEKLGFPVSPLQKMLLMVPAFIGWLLHAPFYYPVKLLTIAFFNNDHYDSVQASLLMLLYPVYILIIIVIAYTWTGWLALLLLLMMPLTAWCFLHWKEQFPHLHKKSEPAGSLV